MISVDFSEHSIQKTCETYISHIKIRNQYFYETCVSHKTEQVTVYNYSDVQQIVM